MSLAGSGDGWRLGAMGRHGMNLCSEDWMYVIRSCPSWALAVDARTATHWALRTKYEASCTGIATAVDG